MQRIMVILDVSVIAMDSKEYGTIYTHQSVYSENSHILNI